MRRRNKVWLKFHLARLDSTRLDTFDFVEPVETSVSSESSCAVRLARHSKNAWARHVECVESSRVEPSGIRAYIIKFSCLVSGLAVLVFNIWRQTG